MLTLLSKKKKMQIREGTYFFCVLHHPMDLETPNIPPGDLNIRKLFSGEAEACTPPGVLLRYLWGLYIMSCLICMIFVADLIAYTKIDISGIRTQASLQ